MNFKYKTIFSDSTPWGLLVSVARIVCVAAMAYYTGKAVVSGVRTLGAIIYSLFPVITFGGILLLLETSKRNLSYLFSLPTLSDIKASKKYVPLLVSMGIVSVLFVLYSGISSAIDMIMVLMVLIMAIISSILMVCGRGTDALCVFILAWPMMIFERSQGRCFYNWNKQFEKLAGHWTSYIEMDFCVCLLILALFIRVLLIRQRLVPATWSPGIWLLASAGLLSTAFTPIWRISVIEYIILILMPVLFFMLCVNVIRSRNDLKKLSLAIGVSIGILTYAWLYYALYRTPQDVSTLIELASLRGAGGRTLGRYLRYEYFPPLVLPSVLAMAFTAESRFIKGVWLGTSLLMIGASLYTFGRMGCIALVPCLLPWFWHLRGGRWLGLSLLAGLSVAAVIIPEPVSTFFFRFKPLLSWYTFQQMTWHYRIWKGAWHMFMDHPWTGVGVARFGEHAADYGLTFSYMKGAGISVSHVWIEAHSSFFQIISTMGILGLIAWSLLMWIPVRTLIRNKNELPLLPPHERPWGVAMQSYALVVILYLFMGSGLGHLGIETPRTLLFILWLAVLSNKESLLRDLPWSKDPVKYQPRLSE